MGKTQQGRAYPMPAGIGIGVLTAVLVTLLGAVGITGMIAGEKLTVEGYGYAVMTVLFLAGLAGAWVAMAAIKHRKMQVCLLTGAGYYLILLASNAMFFGGQYAGVLTAGLLILAGSMIPALIGSKGGRVRHRKPSYR